MNASVRRRRELETLVPQPLDSQMQANDPLNRDRPHASVRSALERLLCALLIAAMVSRPSRAADEFFEKQIRPLLAEHCQSCHGDQKQEGGLRLTTRESLLKGGETGRAVVPGKAEESLLIKVVGYLNEPKMPPKQKLPDADIAKLKHWVALGAPWPGL